MQNESPAAVEADDVAPITLRQAARRALVAFLAVLVAGGAALWLVLSSSDQAPVAAVRVKSTDPTTVRAPDRPARYPDLLPTLDNITVLQVRPEPGAVLIELASPSTPADTIAMVRDALVTDGWEVQIVASTNRILGTATKDGDRVGLEITGDYRKGTPTGWITIQLLIEDEAESVEPAFQPTPPPEAIS